MRCPHLGLNSVIWLKKGSRRVLPFLFFFAMSDAAPGVEQRLDGAASVTCLERPARPILTVLSARGYNQEDTRALKALTYG